MEVPTNIGTKVRRHITPIKSENQIIPAAAVLKRGRLDLGVVLCIRGNKVHYYSFIKQGKESVFEEWLFRMPVKLGQQRVENFIHLKKLLSTVHTKDKRVSDIDNHNVNDTKREKEKETERCVHGDLFSSIRQTFSKVEAVTLANCVNENSCTIIDKLNEIHNLLKTSKVEMRKNQTEMQFETQMHLERIEALNNTISTLQKKLNDLSLINNYQENHATTTLNFNGCYFNQPADEFLNREEASTNSGTQQKRPSASESEDDQEFESANTLDSSDEDGVNVFKVNSVINEHHWNKFQMYYRRFPIMDVFFSEITWMKKHGMFELVREIAPYVMGPAPPIQRKPIIQSLRILFNILRTSRICR